MSSIILSLSHGLRTGKPPFVSITTNILTGLLGMSLLAVTFWFIYQLKRDSVWVNKVRMILRWIGNSQVWKCIRKVWKRIIEMRICRWIRHPQREYRQNENHLRRNLFWCFNFSLIALYRANIAHKGHSVSTTT